MRCPKRMVAPKSVLKRRLFNCNKKHNIINVSIEKKRNRKKHN